MTPGGCLPDALAANGDTLTRITLPASFYQDAVGAIVTFQSPLVLSTVPAEDYAELLAAHLVTQLESAGWCISDLESGELLVFAASDPRGTVRETSDLPGRPGSAQ